MKMFALLFGIAFLMVGCGSADNQVEVARTPIGSGFDIVQVNPQGGATVDDYLIVYCGERGSKSGKQVLVIKGRKRPLKIIKVSEHLTSIEVEPQDLPGISFFDSGIKGGKIAIGLPGTDTK